MNTVPELKARLIAVKDRWWELADASGVPYHTLRKIAQDKTKNPRIETFVSLTTALEKWDRKGKRP